VIHITRHTTYFTLARVRIDLRFVVTSSCK
jgi:hypothetical protein